MFENIRLYLVGGGTVLLIAVLCGRAASRHHPLTAVQIVVSIVWSALVSMHFWGVGVKLSRGSAELMQLSPPVLLICVFWFLFTVAFTPNFLLMRWFMSRLSRESETRAAAWCRAVCAWAGGMAGALLLIMNVALLLPPESEAAVDKLTRQAGRVPLACYLRWSGNWAKPEDRPATLADYLNRWMAR